METSGVLLTIFTPTFNRARLLPRVFSSLKPALAQFGSVVEWLIVDDGSTDDTVAVVESFQTNGDGCVRVVRTANGGKHRAISTAANAAQGRWIMILDSDDWLEDGVMPEIMQSLQLAESDPAIAVVRAFRRFVDRPTPATFGVRGEVAKHRDWVDHHRIFDTAEVVRADVLRRFPFPSYDGELFMAESWLWNSIDEAHFTRFVERAWTVCEYQPGGLSAKSAQLRIRSPRGAMTTYDSVFRHSGSRARRAKSAINWWRFRFHFGGSPDVRCGSVPLRYAPAGWIAWALDVLKRPAGKGI